jgi:hypothetical protein
MSPRLGCGTCLLFFAPRRKVAGQRLPRQPVPASSHLASPPQEVAGEAQDDLRVQAERPHLQQTGSLAGRAAGRLGGPRQRHGGAGSGPERLPPPPPHPRAQWPRAHRRRAPHCAGRPPGPQSSAARAPGPCARSAPRAPALWPRLPARADSAPSAPAASRTRGPELGRCPSPLCSGGWGTRTRLGLHPTGSRIPRRQRLLLRALVGDRGAQAGAARLSLAP